MKTSSLPVEQTVTEVHKVQDIEISLTLKMRASQLKALESYLGKRCDVTDGFTERETTQVYRAVRRACQDIGVL